MSTASANCSTPNYLQQPDLSNQGWMPTHRKRERERPIAKQEIHKQENSVVNRDCAETENQRRAQRMKEETRPPAFTRSPYSYRSKENVYAKPSHGDTSASFVFPSLGIVGSIAKSASLPSYLFRRTLVGASRQSVTRPTTQGTYKRARKTVRRFFLSRLLSWARRTEGTPGSLGAA